MKEKFQIIASQLEGDFFFDESTLILYATDASAYREKPLAVARPKHAEDIRKLILFANEHKIPLIPRAAGTSLAGQVVGKGIVVDISKHLTQILEINTAEKWVRVQPGVVLDELNRELEKHGLFFGPEASTANRCMIGGMLGNNACGLHSLTYGSTREHTLEVKTLLSDGSEVVFKDISETELQQKMQTDSLEGKIYKKLNDLLSDKTLAAKIKAEYPKASIQRRNSGYALDLLLDTEIYSEKSEKKYNLSKLLAGSEGTLAFTTEIKLNLVEMPPKIRAVVPVHLNKLDDAFRANLIALKHNPRAVELMDKAILDCTKGSLGLEKYRFFLKGDPEAILIVEFAGNTEAEILAQAKAMQTDMEAAGYGYHFPLMFADDMKKVWFLRKAGLGVLSNIPGDGSPVSVIEDTAVDVADLPDYMADFRLMLEMYGLDCVFHAHIGTGELHLRPILNLKDPHDVELFRSVARDTANLVKKYNGSLSGEHGDGRLRGEFIPLMLGDEIYEKLKEVKQVWDPNGIFNPGKIVNTPAMNTHLRVDPEKSLKEHSTIFDFSATGGILRSAEMCNGSGDCRKSHLAGGTMCPSYQATRDEKNTTRGRANTLREILTQSDKKNPFDSKEIYEVMDLCLSCKACKSECPSGVDVAKLKAEFLQHYYDTNGAPLRSKLIANIGIINAIGILVPRITNFFLTNPFFANLFKKMFGFAPKRSIPTVYKTSLKRWFDKQNAQTKSKRTVYLFNDEFTNLNDTEIGVKAILLLQELGYAVKIPPHKQSGRTYLSKGFLRKAQVLAKQNVEMLAPFISDETPLIGIEPSAILTFRDEYPDLLRGELKNKALALKKNALMIDEFLHREMLAGNIKQESFTKEAKEIKLHGHCQQKAVASTVATKAVLGFPENYSVTEIPSGCCGMAGSFGYEKEHYDLSMAVGELVLFPAVREAKSETIIAAPGTSCRHQIKDGTNRVALHPVEVLFDALVE